MEERSRETIKPPAFWNWKYNLITLVWVLGGFGIGASLTRDEPGLKDASRMIQVLATLGVITSVFGIMGTIYFLGGVIRSRRGFIRLFVWFLICAIMGIAGVYLRAKVPHL